MGSKQSSGFVRDAIELMRAADDKLYDALNIAKSNVEKQRFVNGAISRLEKALELLRKDRFS